MTAQTPRSPASAPWPRQSIAVARRGTVSVKSVGSFLPGLTARAFAKFGFTTAQLVTDWPTIVGKELAAVCAPERLKWPPRPAKAEAPDQPAPQRRAQPMAERPERRGATLVVRVEGARALDLHYQSRQLLERVNAYFGYAAVGELRLLQAPLAPALPTRGRMRAPVADVAAAAAVLGAGIGDGALCQALERLAAHVQAGRAASR
jgi:hypothetical protein